MNEAAEKFVQTLDLVHSRLGDIDLVISDLVDAVRSNPETMSNSLNVPVRIDALEWGIWTSPVAGACGNSEFDPAAPLVLTDATAHVESALRSCADVVAAATKRSDEASG